MPSSIFFNGQRVYRPGTYVRVNDTLSAISDLTGGNIALVGDFPIFAKAEMQTFASYDTFVETINPDGVSGEYGEGADKIDYNAIADLAFDAMIGASQQIDSLSIINTRTTTQASFTNNGLKVKSKLYGPVGNRLAVTLSSAQDRTGDVADAPFFDIKVFNGGLEAVEEMLDIGDGIAAQLKYEYTADPVADADGEFDYGSVTAQITATHINIEARKSIPNADIINVANQVDVDGTAYYELKFNKQVDGKVQLTTLGNQTEADNDALITGFDSTGTLITERVVLNDTGDSVEAGDNFETDAHFVSIEKIQIKGSVDGDVVLRWFPKSTKLEDVGDLEGWLADLNRRNGDFTYVSPSTVITGDELDLSSGLTSIVAANFNFKTDLHRIAERAFNASKWVMAEKVSNEMPSLADGAFSNQPLIGGVIAASTAVSDVQAALDSILYKNVNIIVPATEDIEIHKLVRDHCKEAAEKAGLERNCWLGTEPNRTLDYVHNIYVKELNDRNCAVVCQGVKLAKIGREYITPWYTALALASVQASTAISEPMTRKILRGIEPIQTTFDPDLDANKAIRLSIVVINSANGPIRVERSITTYRRNLNHPVFNEVSANESVNACLRTLRSRLDIHVGSKATADQAQRVSRAAQAVLQELRDKAIIANFKDVSVILNGDVLNITFDLAAIEPLNFITVQANLGQF